MNIDNVLRSHGVGAAADEYKFEAGDATLLSLPTANTNSTSYVRDGYVQLNVKGVVRVSFSLQTANASVTVYGRLYKNGVAIGVERSSNDLSWKQFTEDIAVDKGDTIEFWIRTSNSSYACYTGFREIKCAMPPFVVFN